MKKSFFIDAVAILYICLLLYTGGSKLMDYSITLEQMALVPILSPVAGVLVWLLPLTEFVIAALLFIPATKIKGLYLATGLMILFSLYIVYILSYDAELPCTCGGFLSALSWPAHLVFNLVFIFLSGLAIYLHRKGRSDSTFTTAKRIL